MQECLDGSDMQGCNIALQNLILRSYPTIAGLEIVPTKAARPQDLHRTGACPWATHNVTLV